MRSSVHDEVSAQQNQGAEPKQMRDRYFGSIFLLESVQATHLVTVLIIKKKIKRVRALAAFELEVMSEI